MLYDRVSFPEHAAMEASLVRIADYPFHMHKDVLEIIFLLEGRLELTVVNNMLEMESGDIYISSSNELHRLRAVEEQDNLVMILHLDLSVFMRDVPDINSYQFANSAIEKNRSGVRILGSYLKNQATRIFFPPQSDTLREIGGRILRILIAEFQCYYLGRYFPEFSNAFKDNEVQLNRIRRTCDYIYANLDQPLRVVREVLPHDTPAVPPAVLRPDGGRQRKYLHYLDASRGIPLSGAVCRPVRGDHDKHGGARRHGADAAGMDLSERRVLRPSHRLPAAAPRDDGNPMRRHLGGHCTAAAL